VNDAPEHQHLRVLIANQRSDRLDYVTSVVVGLGHEVVARSIEVGEVAAVTQREHPDVALVGLSDNSEHALELIGEIVRQAACPVIAAGADDHVFVGEGAGAACSPTSPTRTPTSCRTRSTLCCAGSPSSGLEGAFGRRAVPERAKGILMERHDTNESQAFGVSAHAAARIGS
jgi:response regulator NasT